MEMKYLLPIFCTLVLVINIVEAGRDRVPCPVRKVKSVGSPEGAGPFTDGKIWPYGKITRFHFCIVDSMTVAFTYGNVTTPWHGRLGLGDCLWLKINEKEWINTATLYIHEAKIVSIEFKTNERKIGPYGKQQGKKVFVNGKGGKLAFVSGRVGDYIRQIDFWFYYVA